MILDHAWIAAHIPHRGAMCLLDRVLEWDEQQIVCQAVGHQAGDHPLRSNGCLHAACGIEYAAQAMAIHGALRNPHDAPPRAGFLASVRAVEFAVERLDDIGSPLTIRAKQLGGDGNSVLYAFVVVGADDATLLSGRAAVILDAGEIGARPAAPAPRSGE